MAESALGGGGVSVGLLSMLVAPPVADKAPPKRSRPREPMSCYGHIRAVLAAKPFRAIRARDVRRGLVRRGVRLSHEAVAQKLHKMALRGQVSRVMIPGEWFSRWQA